MPLRVDGGQRKQPRQWTKLVSQRPQPDLVKQIVLSTAYTQSLVRVYTQVPMGRFRTLLANDPGP